MFREPEPMRQIHDIRMKLYEEEKHMSVEKRIAKRHMVSKSLIKRYGLKFVAGKTNHQ